MDTSAGRDPVVSDAHTLEDSEEVEKSYERAFLSIPGISYTGPSDKTQCETHTKPHYVSERAKALIAAEEAYQSRPEIQEMNHRLCELIKTLEHKTPAVHTI